MTLISKRTHTHTHIYIYIFINMVLEDQKDQVDRLCEEWRVLQCQGGEEHRTVHSLKRRTVDWTGRILCKN